MYETHQRTQTSWLAHKLIFKCLYLNHFLKKVRNKHHEEGNNYLTFEIEKHDFIVIQIVQTRVKSVKKFLKISIVHRKKKVQKKKSSVVTNFQKTKQNNWIITSNGTTKFKKKLRYF